MARRKRHIPTVGRRGSGSVRLTHGVRHHLHHQARRRAHQYYRGQVRSDRAALKQIRRQKRTQLQSVSGATAQASSAISQAERDAKKSGLKGQYLGQVIQELSARQADLPQSAQLLRGDIQQQFQSDITGARQQIASDKVDQQRKAQELFASYLSKAQTQARSTISKRRTKNQDQAQKSGQKLHDLKTAIRTGALLLHTTPQNKLPWAPATIKHFGSPADAWRGFTRELLGQEGVSDPAVAMHATSIIRKRLRKKNRAAFSGSGPFASGTANVVGG